MQTTMDNNNDLHNGHISMAVSIVTAALAWISSHDIGELVKGLAAVVSIGAGCMAIRYYYYATIKAKK
jgi:hypothetical protein